MWRPCHGLGPRAFARCGAALPALDTTTASCGAHGRARRSGLVPRGDTRGCTLRGAWHRTKRVGGVDGESARSCEKDCERHLAKICPKPPKLGERRDVHPGAGGGGSAGRDCRRQRHRRERDWPDAEAEGLCAAECDARRQRRALKLVLRVQLANCRRSPPPSAWRGGG
jgi:hypothetical protein